MCHFWNLENSEWFLFKNALDFFLFWRLNFTFSVNAFVRPQIKITTDEDGLVSKKITLSDGREINVQREEANRGPRPTVLREASPRITSPNAGPIQRIIIFSSAERNMHFFDCRATIDFYRNLLLHSWMITKWIVIFQSGSHSGNRFSRKKQHSD